MIVTGPPTLSESTSPEDNSLKLFISKLSSTAKVLTQRDGTAYEEATKIFNKDIKRKPRYIVKVGGVSDVIQCVKFATQEKIRVSMRCGGHSIRGDCIIDDALVICGSQLRSCSVDPEARTVTALQGCLLKDIDHETNVFGLCVPGLGTASITGSFGLTLGGGQGYISRKYGLGVDNIVAANMVLADGSVVKCSQTQNTDLFWAIRGGSGRFGVVTHLTFRLIESPPMNVSTVLWPFDENIAVKIVTEYISWCANLPIESAAMLFFNVIPLPNGPTPVIMLILTHQGTVEEGKKLLELILTVVDIPPISNTTNAMEYIKLQSMLDNFAESGAAYEKNGYILKESLTQDFVKDFVKSFSLRPANAMLGLYNLCCGGVVKNENPHASYATELRKAEQVYIIYIILDEDREKCIQWARETDRKIPSCGVYINASALEDKAEDSFLGSYKRLKEIKNKYDPNGLFGSL